MTLLYRYMQILPEHHMQGPQIKSMKSLRPKSPQHFAPYLVRLDLSCPSLSLSLFDWTIQ